MRVRVTALQAGAVKLLVVCLIPTRGMSACQDYGPYLPAKSGGYCESSMRHSPGGGKFIIFMACMELGMSNEVGLAS